MAESLSPLKSLETVADVRCFGAIGVVEMREPVDVALVQKRLLERGAWLRPFGKLVYCMPPFVISDADLKTLCNAVVETVESL